MCAATPCVMVQAQSTAEHQEFDAQLAAPYRVTPGQTSSVTLYFTGASHVRWELLLLGPDGQPRQQWHGRTRLAGRAQTITVQWTPAATAPSGPSAPAAAATPAASAAFSAVPGTYRWQLHARSDTGASITQSWEVGLGLPTTPPLPALTAVPGRAAGLPYHIYLGNLHSQTNHSDGGAALAGCHGAQPPQSAPFGPVDAYTYAAAHGLDFLMTSEHNHMFDGSDGTQPDADPAAARALYHSGLQAASDYTAADPGFLALYGQEWGVIKHGGHLNIFNSEQLLGWEKNSQQQLLADVETPRADYAGLYHLMQRHDWIGQFNHPASGQFLAAGQPLGYTADGDAVMVLCEVMNSHAFSSHSDEAEPRHSSYEAGCNSALAAGYHVAFSSNQDNHCANWGTAYSNRTGILIPSATPLSRSSLLEALRARRVFATMDRAGQLILQANGHLMGERFPNLGPLHLQLSYSSSNGHHADSVQILHGIAGGHGSVSVVSHSADTLLTPEAGEHFYYGRLTQDDGKVLWTAPVWVSQQAATAAH